MITGGGETTEGVRPTDAVTPLETAPASRTFSRRTLIIEASLITALGSCVSAALAATYASAVQSDLAPSPKEIVFPKSTSELNFWDMFGSLNAGTTNLRYPGMNLVGSLGLHGTEVILSSTTHLTELNELYPEIAAGQPEEINAADLALRMEEYRAQVAEAGRDARQKVADEVRKRHDELDADRLQAVVNIAEGLREQFGPAFIPVATARETEDISDAEIEQTGFPLVHWYERGWARGLQNEEILGQVCVGHLLEAYSQNSPEFQIWLEAFRLMSGLNNVDGFIGELEARRVRPIPIGSTLEAFRQLADQFRKTGLVNVNEIDLPEQNPALKKPFSRAWSTTTKSGGIRKIPVTVSQHATSLFRRIAGLDVDGDGKGDLNYNMYENALVLAYPEYTLSDQGILTRLVMVVARVDCGFNLTVDVVERFQEYTPTITNTYTLTVPLSETPSPSPSPSATITIEITGSPTPTPTSSHTITPEVTITVSTSTPEGSKTPTITTTSTRTSTPTNTPTFTSTPTNTPTITPTSTAKPTSTPIELPTPTNTPAITPTPTAKPTSTPIVLPTSTRENPTATPEPQPIPTPVPTLEPTPIPIPTPLPATSTPAPQPTVVETSDPTPPSGRGNPTETPEAMKFDLQWTELARAQLIALENLQAGIWDSVLEWEESGVTYYTTALERAQLALQENPKDQMIAIQQVDGSYQYWTAGELVNNYNRQAEKLESSFFTKLFRSSQIRMYRQAAEYIKAEYLNI